MSEADEYPEPCTKSYQARSLNDNEFKRSPKQEHGFMSKIFSSKKKRMRALKLRSPLVCGAPAKKLSPRKIGRMMPNEGACHHLIKDSILLEGLRNPRYHEFEVSSPRGDSPEEMEEEERRVTRELRKKEKLPHAFCRDNAVLVEGPEVSRPRRDSLEEIEEERRFARELRKKEKLLQAFCRDNVVLVEVPEISPMEDSLEEMEEKERRVTRDLRKKEKLLQAFRRDNAVLQVVNVEDRGTDPWDQKTTVDQGTDPLKPPLCTLPACRDEKKLLCNRVQETEKAIATSFQEGCNLLKEIQRIKETVFNWQMSGEKSDYENPCSANELIQTSYKCLREISAQLSLAQKTIQDKCKNLNDKLTAIKKEKAEDEGKIKKLELLMSGAEENEENIARLRAQKKNLSEALEHAKKLQKEADRLYKERLDKLEKELALQKQSNTENSKTAEVKSRKANQLERTVEKLHAGMDEANRQISELHSSYKSKIASLEQEHTSKVSGLCENQAQTNKQLTHALDQSSKYVELYQEVKKENVSLAAENRALREKSQAAEREASVAVEKCLTAERKLAREAKQVEKLTERLTRLSDEAEQELLTVNGDLWCQIMKHHDRTVIDDYAASLENKEKALEALRAQGDCALKDFEKAQSDLQKRRQQFKELKGVLFDFERKRETVVREQREFYSTIATRDKVHVSKDAFFQDLIEECQTKSERIEELLGTLKSMENRLEETNRVSEAQLTATQAEMKRAADKLQEFENQIRINKLQMQEAIKVFEQEKRNKSAAEEAMNAYKSMLEDSKKENSELRCKLNLFEDFAKHRTNGVRSAEDVTVETQKRKETECKLKRLEKEFQEMKSQMQSGGNRTGDLSKMDQSQLVTRVRELTEDNKYLERILTESQLSKESLLKDHGDLSKKLRQAMRIMVHSKAMFEELEGKLERRSGTIERLEASQLDTEGRLRALKEVVREMQGTIDDLEDEREDLEEELDGRRCGATGRELEALQHERESLLGRLRDNELTIRDQQRRISAVQRELEGMSHQLRETRAALNAERHRFTQEVLDRKKMQLYVQELEGRLALEARLEARQAITTDTTDAADSSPQYSDSYDPPHRERPKPLHYRK